MPTVIEFCSGGPKNYGYRTKNGKVMCKVSGFSLKGRRECSIELRRLASKHLGRMTSSSRQTSHHMRHAISHHPKKSQDYTLETRLSHKDYRFVHSKRVPEPIKTYLYGYECLTDGRRLSRLIWVARDEVRHQVSSHVPVCTLFVH